MQDLNALALFVEVAQSGSYTAAAKQLTVPLSTVSRKVVELEKNLGVQLFHRTTRQVRLTEIGERYLHYCQQMVNKADEAEQAIMSLQSEPSGTLRFGVPFFTDDSFGSGMFRSFLQCYPKINVECVVLANNTDPVSNNLDCIINYGPPTDLDLQTRSLGSLNLMLFASPAYLEKEGQPQDLADLVNHSAVRLKGLDWERWGPTSFQQQKFRYRFSINDMITARQMVLDSVGIGYFPQIFCAQFLESGQLLNILPEFNQPLPLQICFPPNRHISRKLRVFIDHLLEVCRQEATWDFDG